MEVNLTLTIDEIELILKGLAKLPYEEVNKLFPKIRDEAQEQVNQQQSQKWHSSTT